MDAKERDDQIGKLAKVMQRTMPPLFRRVVRKNEMLYGGDKTFSKISILVTLKHDGPMPPSVIAERTYYSRQNLTSLTDHLEAEGLAVRVPNPNDRRSTNLEITKAGIEYIHVNGERLKRSLIEEMACLDDPDIESLCTAFDTIERVFQKIATVRN